MKIGRNTPCFCGSGKKFKMCCQKKIIPFPNGLRDRQGAALPIGAEPGMFRVTIASPENPDVVLHDISFPLGATSAAVRKKVRQVMQSKMN